MSGERSVKGVRNLLYKEVGCGGRLDGNMKKNEVGVISIGAKTGTHTMPEGGGDITHVGS